MIRKVREAWDTRRDTLVKSGAFAIEQLSEALSSSASSNTLPDGLPQNALRLCSEQVSLISLLLLYLRYLVIFLINPGSFLP